MRPLPTKFIPVNEYYCYENLEEKTDHWKVHGLCPYWKRTGKLEGQCSYLGFDESKAFENTALFDQVKICGMNLTENDVE